MISKFKILNAINEGVKASFKFSNNLGIDNSSIIDFNDSKINNAQSLNLLALNKQFIEFIENKDFDAANDYLEIYGENVAKPLKYKVKDYKELLEYLKWDEWFNYVDYSHILTIYMVDKDIDEVELCDWQPKYTPSSINKGKGLVLKDHNIAFIKISTPILKETNNEIYLSVDWKYCHGPIIDTDFNKYEEIACSVYTKLTNGVNDADGYKNTLLIKKYIIDNGLSSKLFKNFDKQKPKTNIGEFESYLPAICLLATFCEYDLFIDYVLTLVGATNLSFDKILMSSSEYDNSHIWCFDVNGRYKYGDKYAEHWTIPFFKKVSD